MKTLNKDDVDVSDFVVSGKTISDRKQKSEILSGQFVSVFTEESIDCFPDICEVPSPSIDPLIISVREVMAQLSAWKPNKAPGPDEIPPWFMKEYANEIAPVLAKIFQQSIDSGDVPKKWKNANVTAIFKKCSRSDPGNYRPISLTCIASKVLEHIVHSHIMKYLNSITSLQTDSMVLEPKDQR